MSGMSENEIAELGCTYAALILHDDKIPVTAEKISALLKAANVKTQPFYPGLFAKVLATKNVDDIIMSAGSGSAAPAPVQGQAEEKKEDSKGGKKEEKKKEEPKEEVEVDMGLSLFD